MYNCLLVVPSDMQDTVILKLMPLHFTNAEIQKYCVMQNFDSGKSDKF